HVRQGPEASDQQSRANHQQHSERDLGDCQRAAQAMRDCSGASAPGSFERFSESYARALKSRSKTKDKTGQDGESSREEQHPPVNMHLVQTRSVSRKNSFEQGNALRSKE